MRWMFLTLTSCFVMVGCQREQFEPTLPTPSLIASPTAASTAAPIEEAADRSAPRMTYLTPRCEEGGFIPDQHGALKEHFIEWTADGEKLVFDDHGTIKVVDAGGANLRTIVDVVSKGGLSWEEEMLRRGLHADVSPDGSHIVYSSCTVQYDERMGGGIAAIGIADTLPKRLTDDNYRLDIYPVWSPGGNRIAFVASDRERDYAYLSIMSADGSEASGPLTEPGIRVAFYPPSWSASGEHLAFLAMEGRGYWQTQRLVLYTVRSDGSGGLATRIAETTAPAAWRPNAEELAVVVADGERQTVYGVTPGSSQLREIWTSDPGEAVALAGPVYQLSWSPDGSELLLVDSYGVHVVGADGAGLRTLAYSQRGTHRWSGNFEGKGSAVGMAQAAWSPDGSRIAVYDSGDLPLWGQYSDTVDASIRTVSRDGTTERVLVEWTEGVPRAVSGPEVVRGPEACRVGIAVPDPKTNPGLVQDCEALLSFADQTRMGFGWSAWRPITEWRGVVLTGAPQRVGVLNLEGLGIAGPIPPALGRLSGLERLNLSNNRLTGGIPPELFQLPRLYTLNLSNNRLNCGIPAELTAEVLSRGLEMVLAGNRFTGCIPPDLWQVMDRYANDLDMLGLPVCELADDE